MALGPTSSLGGEVYDTRLIQALADLGVSFEVLVPRGELGRVLRTEGVSVRPVRLRRARYSNAVFLREALGAYRSRPFDVLRVHTPIYVGAAGVAFRTLHPNVPVVFHHLHLESGALHRRMTGLIGRRATATVAISHFARRQLVEELRLDGARIHVVHPGVDVPEADLAASADLVARHGLDGKQLLVTVGALIPRKNVAELIAAMPDVLARVTGAHLVVIGDGPQRASLEAEVARLGLERSVLFTGFVADERKAEWLRAASVYVSLSTLEGFGLGVAEGQAAGLPAVVSNAGSLPEVVLDGRTGFVVDPLDRAAIVSSIHRFLGDAGLRDRFSTEARRWATRQFTWQAAARGVHEVYREAVEVARSASRWKA